MSFQALASNVGGVSDTQSVIGINTRRIGRLLSVGNSWNVLRVGWRVHVVDTGANITPPVFYMGVMGSIADGFPVDPSGSTTAAYFTSNSSVTFTRSTGPVRYTGSGIETWNNSGAFAFGSNTVLKLSADPTIRNAWIVQFSKNTPAAGGLRMETIRPTTDAFCAVPVTKALLVSAMNQATMADAATTLSYSSVATRDSNQLSAVLGNLNSIFARAGNNVTFKVSDMAFRVIS